MAQVSNPTIEVTEAEEETGATCVMCLRELSDHRVECPDHELLALLWPPNSPDFEMNGIHTLGMERDFLSLALEYLRLCADELQLRLDPYHVLHLPAPTPMTQALFRPELTWRFHWSSSMQPAAGNSGDLPKAHEWGFHFSRSGVTVVIQQNHPPVHAAAKPAILLHHLRPQLQTKPPPVNTGLAYPHSYPDPYYYYQPYPQPPPPPPPPPPQAPHSSSASGGGGGGFEVQPLDRAVCLSDWRALRGELGREIGARERSAANLGGVLGALARVRDLSLDRNDAMWSVGADLSRARRREVAALGVARRNLAAVEAVLEAGCWGAAPGGKAPSSAASAGAQSGTPRGQDGGGEEGGGEGGGGGSRARWKGKGKEKEENEEEKGEGGQRDGDEVCIWCSSEEYEAALWEEWHRYHAFQDRTPVTVVHDPDQPHLPFNKAVRWRLTG